MFRAQVQVAKKTNFYIDCSLPPPSGFERFAPIRGSGERWKSHWDYSEPASFQWVFSVLQYSSLTTADFAWCFKAGSCVDTSVPPKSLFRVSGATAPNYGYPGYELNAKKQLHQHELKGQWPLCSEETNISALSNISVFMNSAPRLHRTLRRHRCRVDMCWMVLGHTPVGSVAAFLLQHFCGVCIKRICHPQFQWIMVIFPISLMAWSNG